MAEVQQTATKNDKQRPKGDKPKKKRSIGRWFKEIFSELKKVSWPTFGKVMKQLGIVIAVVLFFLLVLMGIDSLLSFLYDLLVGKLIEDTGAAAIINLLSGPGIL